MRKIFSRLFILFFVILLCTFNFACTESNREYKTNITESDIAKLTIFSYDGKTEGRLGLMNLGHAFLSIENISNEEFSIANKVVSPSDTISFGTWSILKHFGVWYNVESNYIIEHNKYDGRVSITIGINEENLKTITNYILNNDTWNPLKNCSHFAITLWNLVAEQSEIIDKPIIYTPTHLTKIIEKFDTYETNKPIPTDSKVGYFTCSDDTSFEMEKGASNENI